MNPIKPLLVAAAVSLAAIGCSSSSKDVSEANPTWTTPNTTAAQDTYPSPEEAVAALRQLVVDGAAGDGARVFGPRHGELLSGNEEQDREDIAAFRDAMAQKVQVESDGLNADAATVLIGSRGWAFPVPLVKSDGRWSWDTEADIAEVVRRRIGYNELGAIGVCRAYVVAQREYHDSDHDGDGVAEYATRTRSTPGLRDGLYWEVADGEPLSPLGPLMAEASDTARGAPFYGYLYRILTAQGASAPGGAMDYLANGNMTEGFALLAYPAAYGDTGVVTLVVGPNGVVYEKDLGTQTQVLAEAMQAFDPDEGWAITED